jgi:ubiquinone/menaquinone biosynthesis C-methylase UbiE
VKLESTATGLVIHSPVGYDLRFWLRTRGRERAFRKRLVGIARLEPGESVLDIGCATGSLALAAKRRVGETGVVHGIEPSPAMLARARRRAARARLPVTFHEAVAQELPFADGTFDAVLCTLVLHQLPHDSWRPALEEMRRVLRLGARLLLVDISTDGSRSTPHSHGHFDLERLAPLVTRAGFAVSESGPVEFRLRRFDRLRYFLATA